jgi:hypothetical protein
MQQPADFEVLLHDHVPPQALRYCLNLCREIPFTLRLAPGRVTKAGDFAVRQNRFFISVNRDLNPYLFLLTFIHEIAHAVVYCRHANRCEAHGPEWKTTFRELMEPLLTVEVFPADLLACLKQHLQNPSASSFSDTALTRCLRQYDAPDGLAFLADLPERTVFQLQSRWFIKGPARRKRFVCCDMRTKKIYLVPGQALVRVQQQSLFAAG